MIEYPSQGPPTFLGEGPMEATSLPRDVMVKEYGALFASTMERYAPEYKIDEYKFSLIAAYCTLFFVGICVNAWVASVIGRLLLDGLRHRYGSNSRASLGSLNNGFMRNASNGAAPKPIQIYIFALCCCDLIVLCFLMFLILDLIYGRWVVPWSSFVCQLYLCSESLNKFCGPFFLVALSGYCYVRVCKNEATCSAVAKPTVHQPLLLTGGTSSDVSARKIWCHKFSMNRTLLQTKFSLIVIGVCLFLVFLLITPVYLYGDVYYLILHNSSGYIFLITPKCALQPAEDVLTAFTVYSFICGYLLPAGLFTFFYACIMKRACQHAKLRLEQQRRSSSGLPITENSSNAGGSRRPKTYLGRVVKTTLGLVLFYFFCWTPYWVMSLYQYTVPHDEQGETTHAGIVLSYFVHILPYVNCTGYPILYTVLNKNIKNSYRKVKLKKELKNSKLAFIARQQSENKMMTTNTLQVMDRCRSRCNSFFLSRSSYELSNPGSPKPGNTV